MIAHDVPPLTHTSVHPALIQAILRQCAPFLRKQPNLRVSAGASTPIYSERHTRRSPSV